MKSLGIFRDDVDGSIKCVFDADNSSIIEMNSGILNTNIVKENVL